MTKSISPDTSIYQWNNYLLKTPKANWPFPGQLKEMDFKNHCREVVPEGYKVSDFFVEQLDFSRTEFNRKLKVGAVRKRYSGWPWRKLLQDEEIERGDTDYRIKRLVACIWLYDIKHTFKWDVNYFLSPVYVLINRITRKLFNKSWL